MNPVSITGQSQKCVQFEECVVKNETTRLLSSSPLDRLDSMNARSKLWYRSQEIAKFQKEARQLCRWTTKVRMALLENQVCRRSSDTDNNNNSNNTLVVVKEVQQQRTTPMLAQNDSTRGLEIRMCPERNRRKHLTRRWIVKASEQMRRHDDDDSYKLAVLSQRCTRWAMELALVEAARDHQRALADNSTDDDDDDDDDANRNNNVVNLSGCFGKLGNSN